MFVRDRKIERMIMRQRGKKTLPTLVLMKPLGETSLSFVLCSSSLSHDHSLNLPVSYKQRQKPKLQKCVGSASAHARNGKETSGS